MRRRRAGYGELRLGGSGMAAMLVMLLACEREVLVTEPFPAKTPGDAGFEDTTHDGDVAILAPDAAGHSDAAEALDATLADISARDVDGGLTCDLAALGEPDRTRVVLIGHPFGAMVGQEGTEIRAMVLSSDRDLRADGVRLDVGTRSNRIAFVPSGAFALVLGQDGTLVSVKVESANQLAVVDTVHLPSADYGDLVITSDGRTAFVTGSNVDQTSGISTIGIGCDGSLTVATSMFFNVRLSESLVLLPGEWQAVLLGGQAVFAPVDPADVRLLARNGQQWSTLGAFDVFRDAIDVGRIALSPDGRTLLVPNSSPFSTEGGQVAVVDVDVAGGVLRESHRLMNLPDAREAVFSPSGDSAIVTLSGSDRVAVLLDQGATGFQVVGEVLGIGLPDKMVSISRGSLSGLVFLPSIDPNGGPNVAVLEFTGPGVVMDRGQVELGSGSIDIPDAIAVMP